MLAIYKFDDTKAKLTTQTKITPGVWINAVAPDASERQRLMEKAHVPEDFLLYGLDPDEGARYEYEPDDDAHLLIFDMPIAGLDKKKRVTYKTVPLAIILTKTAIITIDQQSQPLLAMFAENRVPNFNPAKRNQASLMMLYQVTIAYLAKLQNNLKNEELYALMGIQRGLVYFMMSIKTDRNVLDQLRRNNPLSLDEDDQDLLDDIIIENQQGSEMAAISNSILNETSDTYSSIINNNMNGVMKFLTSYSIILTIPTLVFSFYGMNVELPWANMHASWIITIAISIAIGIVVGFEFWRKKYF
jgi:magnesium transporter